MKGIIAIKNQHGKILGYNATQDIDETLEYYENGDTRWKRYMASHPNSKISYEVVKVTDTPEIDVLEYKLPQISRVIYDKELLKGVAFKTANYSAKTLRKVADWFCETYPSQETSMHLYLNDQSELIGKIRIEDGSERAYSFSKSGKATLVD